MENVDTMKNVAVVTVMIGGTIVPALAIAWIGGKGVDAIGRNPEAASGVQTAMIVSIAFAEAIAIYTLVIGLIIKFIA